MSKKNNDCLDKEETFCLVCMETFSSSKPNEEWIQCKLWIHEECARECKIPFYKCDNWN